MITQDDADIKWKFSRTQMWMQYVDKGSALPPPFNLIPAWPDVLRFFRFICGCCRRREVRNWNNWYFSVGSSMLYVKLYLGLLQRNHCCLKMYKIQKNVSIYYIDYNIKFFKNKIYSDTRIDLSIWFWLLKLCKINRRIRCF